MKDIKLVSPSIFGLDGDIFEDKVIKVYEYQNCPENASFSIKSKSDNNIDVHLRIDNQNGSNIKLKDSDNSTKNEITVPLKAREIRTINILISPSTSIGDIKPKVIATADYSSQISKTITIKTKKSPTPKVKLNFTFLQGYEKYYIGEGNIKIGTLEITAEATGSEPLHVYRPIDLNGIISTCNNIKVHTSDNQENNWLYVGNQTTYDVYFIADKKGEYEFNFSIDDTKSPKYTITAKKTGDPLVKEFKPCPNLRFDKLKNDGIVGYLTTQLEQGRGFFPRKNGIFYLTDRLFTFDKEGNVSNHELESGTNKYPIYANLEQLFGNERDNIDSDIPCSINALLYSDSIIQNEQIEAYFEVHHIPASPSSNICILDTSNNVTTFNNLPTIDINEWKYDSIHSSQMLTATIFTICLCNNQKLKYNGNGILWEDIKITGNEIIPQDISRKEIRNGETEIKIPVKVEFAKIRNVNEICINFSCKETINNADTEQQPERKIDCCIKVPVKEIIVDDWYSLDLGTTGIVVAKWNYESETGESDGISAIKLSDYEDALAIERSRNIVSSITILKPSSNNDKLGEVIVAPSTPELKQNAKYVLVPTKFMVGQNVLPFFNIYKMTFPDGLLINGEIYNWEAKTTEDKVITPKEILTHTYKTIFSKISEDECKRIRKLIITYPNTYTPESLDWLRDMIVNSGIFENLSSNNLHFIPESDSVVAYYVKKSMERETNTASERVVIYDMGAGTLDLSYVKISIEEENGRRFKKSAIEKRIGIPIAGEYFSYLIYEDLKEKFTNNDVNYTTKAWIDDLKINYGNITKFNEVQGESLIKSEFSNEKISLGESINKWINICTEQALIKLLGNEWGNSVDRIVLSGRGSQFKPIQDKLKDLSETNGIILDLETITLSELKQCVAEGAILYQKIFENPSLPFSIVHRNSYEHIGIQYRILDEDFTKKWTYKELMNESHLIWDLTPKDGAIFAQVPSIVIENLDFRLDEDIVFYLTSLTESDMLEVIKNPGSEKEVFMNELFRFKPSVLEASEDRKECTLNLSIDSNNKLSISINSMDLLPHSTLPNVEDDKFYVKCNWYLN